MHAVMVTRLFCHFDLFFDRYTGTVLSAQCCRLPFTLITADVAEATSACLLAQAEEAERLKMPPVVQERMVIEEFGRCLMQIIESANKTKGIYMACWEKGTMVFVFPSFFTA